MPIFKYKDENFFKKWTPEMAYVLGFIVADGCLTKNRRGAHFLEIQSTDKKIITKIKKAIRSNVVIGEYQPRILRWKKRYRIQLGSKEIFQDLLRLGIKPRKSDSIRLPTVPDKYFSHFLRGYFDGDGCVNICSYQQRNRKKPTTILNCGFTSGSRLLLADIKRKLKKMGIINGGTLHYHQGYRLWFSINDSMEIYKFMYNGIGNELLLERKKAVFENYIDKHCS